MKGMVLSLRNGIGTDRKFLPHIYLFRFFHKNKSEKLLFLCQFQSTQFLFHIKHVLYNNRLQLSSHSCCSDVLLKEKETFSYFITTVFILEAFTHSSHDHNTLVTSLPVYRAGRFGGILAILVVTGDNLDQKTKYTLCELS
jgi:hypothetical protein